MHLMLPSPVVRMVPKTEPNKIGLQRGPLVFDFSALPDDAKIKGDDAIGNHFDKSISAIVLTGKYYDALGNEQGKYEIRPYAKSHSTKGILTESYK